MIKDAFGLAAQVGDKVAYAPGGAGAQDFHTGKISKVSGKTVTIVDHGELDWMNSPKIIRRGSGCFVIDATKREAEALVGLVALSEQDKKEGRVYSRDQLMEALDE